ncbi:MAG: hypothetical protein KIT73_19530, partial [Burkholderiales bacterium]|nr:hypothetical protein [Burkholderiales bacterium]
DLEEGVLDTARLARIIADPSPGRHFKLEKDARFSDTVVTLLLDNSASMRGQPLMVVAVCADILIQTMERCGVKVEVLGFTTDAWRGGQSRRAWIDAGQPPAPGRLNDLCHIVYKAADMPWRRARHNLGFLMQPGLHKENIDGEALDWAYRRLLARPEKRRILIMISDGAPVDESTLAASMSPGSLLEQHLHAVIAEIEHQGKVELTAIGIGYDVDRFYRRSTKIAEITELATVLVHELARLLDSEAAAPNRSRGAERRASTTAAAPRLRAVRV